MEYLFICLLISIVSLPFFTMFKFLLSSLLSLATSVIQLQAMSHFAWSWSPGSHFLGGHCIPFGGRGTTCSGADGAEPPADDLRVALYESGGEPAECVFCLSGIAEGEEIRETRCGHLFHRHCLDRWLEHRGARCPLCRDVLLVPPEIAAKCLDADDETLLNYSAFVNSALWIW